jgi:hypothetical protein
MPFELETPTKVRVLDVRVLAAKDRKPDDPPGAQMLLQADLPADVLSMFDRSLKFQMFRRAGSKQGTLEGIDSLEKTTFAEHVKRLKWQYEQTGCMALIDHGTGGKSNISLADCKAHRVLISPREASVVVQWTLDAPALSDATRGKLTGLKATEILMTQFAPVAEEAQQEIEPKPGKSRVIDASSSAKDLPKDATAVFSETHGNGAGKAEEPLWPFPEGDKPTEAPPQSATTEVVVETSRPGTRTARGRDKTKAALAAKATH